MDNCVLCLTPKDMAAEQNLPPNQSVPGNTTLKATSRASLLPGQLLGPALAGAGVLLAVQSVLMALFAHQSVWKTSWVVAAIFMGPEVLHWPPVFDFAALTAALTALYPTALVCGVVLCLATRRLGLNYSLLVGGLIGLLFCPIDLYAPTRLFPWLAEERNWMAPLSYLLFGGVTAWLLRLVRQE
jgi:hypothetical protein